MHDLDKFIIQTVFDDYYRDWDYNMVKKDKGRKKGDKHKKKRSKNDRKKS